MSNPLCSSDLVTNPICLNTSVRSLQKDETTIVVVVMVWRRKMNPLIQMMTGVGRVKWLTQYPPLTGWDRMPPNNLPNWWSNCTSEEERERSKHQSYSLPHPVTATLALATVYTVFSHCARVWHVYLFTLSVQAVCIVLLDSFYQFTCINLGSNTASRISIISLN